MTARVLGFLGVLAALSGLGGCGKSEDGAEPIPQGELASRIASLACESLSDCCQRSGFGFDVAGCKRAATAEFQEEIAEELEHQVAYDAQAAGDCLAAAGSQVVCGEVEDIDAPACERMFRGTVAVGQPCSVDRECAPQGGRSVTCFSSDGVSPQVCTELASTNRRRGKAGEACFSTCSEGATCGGVVGPAPGPGVPVPAMEPATCYRDDGLYCATNGVCAPLIAVGEPCASYEGCRGNAFCDVTAGFCVAPRENGQRCSGGGECQSGVCEYPNENEPFGTCVAERLVSASQCEHDFSEPPPDSSGPSGAPEPAPGAP